MNDFSEKAATSCISQNYPRFHVFILDDSTEPQHWSQVDAFHARFPEKTTILRRANREGFKAGNLNHAVRLIAADYEYFAVCDADGVLPLDFLSKTMNYFSDNDNIGFVQSRQRATIWNGGSSFAIDLAVGVDIYWERIISPAQTFGFVLFHGHGGVIRTNVWSEIGGFPTVVGEDLAFSTRAREKGYVGVIADDVVCDEEFPASYDAFSTRQLKYARSAFEHLKLDMWSFLFSSQVTWIEKIDRLLADLAMVSPLPLLIFLLDFALVLPFAFGTRPNRLDIGGARIWGILTIDTNHLPAFTWPLFIMTVITLLAPMVPAACHLRKDPARFLRYVAVSVAVHLSLVFDQAWNICMVAVTGRNSFPVTGDRTGYGKAKVDRKEAGPTIRAFGTLLLLAAAVLSAGVGLLPICLATGMGLAASRLRWEHILVQVAIRLPITAVLLLIIFGCSLAVGLCGLSVSAFTSGF